MVNLKDVELTETNEAYNKVLYWFFSFPDSKISLTELVKKTKISKKNASKIVNSLADDGFLLKEVFGKSWVISCNKIHFFNNTRKIAFNLSMIYNSDILYEIKKIVANFQAIILFGSYRKGDDIDKSDIDIAVNVLGNKTMKIEELGKIRKFGYRKDVRVNLHIFSKDNIDKNLFSNIANGIVLEGFLEVLK